MTVGGTISGYWATGSVEIDSAPTMIVTIEMTDAKTGRSIKKCANFNAHLLPEQCFHGVLLLQRQRWVLKARDWARMPPALGSVRLRSWAPAQLWAPSSRSRRLPLQD